PPAGVNTYRLRGNPPCGLPHTTGRIRTIRTTATSHFDFRAARLEEVAFGGAVFAGVNDFVSTLDCWMSTTEGFS
ncbi:hypothetical protein, partial [Nocardia wallacei]|uniref:hypothetical protein n=1 Tax=Nocardia wallacei TaxID=480035 RepID=UPI0024547A26